VLFLLFELAGDRYALDVAQIAAVLPLVELTRIPHAPAGVDGLITYRGAPVPVIDLSQLMLGRPSVRRLSTRIVLVHYRDAATRTHLLGLVAERATRTARHEATDFNASGITSSTAPYLGRVATDADGLLQWIDVRTLLPASLRDLLFRDPTDEPWPLPT
jgi:chemotaxis-related protein WspB